MKSRFILWGLLCIGICGCGSKPPVPPIEKWITWDSFEGYTMLLPQQPVTFDKEIKGNVVMFAVYEINPDLGVVISSSGMPDATLQDAAKRKAALAKHLKDVVGEGKLLEEKAIPGPGKLSGLGYKATTSLQNKEKGQGI